MDERSVSQAGASPAAPGENAAGEPSVAGQAPGSASDAAAAPTAATASDGLETLGASAASNPDAEVSGSSAAAAPEADGRGGASCDPAATPDGAESRGVSASPSSFAASPDDASAASSVPASPDAAPALDAQWQAYRDSLIAYASDAPAAATPGDPRAAVPEPLRPGVHSVHHSFIWLGGLSASLAAVPVIAVSSFGSLASAFEAASSALPLFAIVGLSVLAVAVVVAAVFLFQWLSWKNLSYELGTSEFSLFSGIINKKRVHVPYQRVQSVNQQAGVLQRVLGICNVKIDTAGGSANEAVMLRYVRASDAEALRAELFRRKKVLAAGGAIDGFGNAFVGGSVVPSAWMLACAAGDARAVRIAFGETASRVDASLHAAQAPSSAASGAPAAQGQGNVLDGADEILHDLRGVFGGGEVATGAVSYEAGLSNKELFFAGLSGAAGHFGVIIAGIIGIVGSVAQFFEANIESWVEVSVGGSLPAGSSDVAVEFGGLLGSFTWQVALWAVISVAALWAFSVLGTIVQYGGFKARRRESRIEVEYGLLQRSFHGVDVDRVQTVVVKQSFVRRLIGYCELSVGKIDSIEKDGGSNQPSLRGMVIHPFVKKSRVPEIVAGVLPEFADMPVEDVKPAKAALRRALLRRCVVRSVAFWLFVAVSLVHAGMEAALATNLLALDLADYAAIRMGFMAYYTLFALIVVLNAVDAVLWYRSSGLGYDRSFMSITNGGLSSKTVVFPRRKIQFASIKTNPFQRMAHVAIVCARTAAGVGGTTERLWDVSEADADAWMEWARPRASLRDR